MTAPTPPSEQLLLPAGTPERDPDRAKEHVSTVLSTASMVAIVVGVAWGLWPLVGPWAVAIGGLLLGGLVTLADAARRPRPAVDPEPEPKTENPPPGPSDPGRVHTKGPGAKP